MYDINKIADFFINKVDENKGDVITNLKIQKLLYFAWGWYFTLYGKLLFEDRPEPWNYGPVFNSMYQRFKSKGNKPITTEDIKVGDGGILLDDEMFLNDIWEEYGQYSAEKLADMSHDKAWLFARELGESYINQKNILEAFQEIQKQEEEQQDKLDIVDIMAIDMNDCLSVDESMKILMGHA